MPEVVVRASGQLREPQSNGGGADSSPRMSRSEYYWTKRLERLRVEAIREAGVRAR
jgi:hypothetical protein